LKSTCENSTFDCIRKQWTGEEERMRTVCEISFTLWLLVITGCGEASTTTSSAPHAASPFSVLDAYGQWIDYPGYGQVWQPRVGYDWQPFLDGRWVWTESGWLWDSEEPFGWVVYHYGYWVEEGAAGWLWIPGYDWSPARVRWIVRDDMIGWAPELPPGARLPVASRARVWVVVSPQQLMNRNVGRYRISSPAIENIPEDQRAHHQPDVREIERLRGRPIAPTRVETEHVRSGNRNLVRFSIDESDRNANGPVIMPKAMAPPPLPTVVSPRRSPQAAKPAQPVAPVRTRKSNADSVKAPPTVQEHQPEKDKKAVKENKGLKKNPENRDKAKERKRVDALKK
jgi:hypothetical protein